ncbi:MAG TPA: hypothetical protein VGB55_00570 [Tepidisphaeraceae bacterium]
MPFGTSEHGYETRYGADSIVVTLSGLPAHSMIRVNSNHDYQSSSVWPSSSSDASDGYTIAYADETYTFTQAFDPQDPYGWLYGGTGRSESGRLGKWVQHDSGSLTITLSTVGLEADEYFAFWGFSVSVYQPTVSIGGGGTTSEEATTPTTFTISRDLPNGYGGTSAGDETVPDLAIDLTRGGSATFGDDYTGDLPQGDSVTLTGTAPHAFSVTPIFDNETEANEKVVFTAQENALLYTIAQSSASATIIDAGEMTLETKIASDGDPEGLHQAFETSGSSASTGFRVEIEVLSHTGWSVPTANVEDQVYTISVTGNSYLSAVSDSQGNVWTVNNTTATLIIEDRTAATSFDIYVGLTVTGPGEINVNLDAAAKRGGMAYSSSSSSDGRAIAPAANPGPLEVSSRIYHIVDRGNVGHSAVLISAENGGIIYYSYSSNDLVTVQFYNSIADALAAAKAAGYDEYQFWNITPQQATAARAAANAFNGTDYGLFTHNCWDMVASALGAAQTNAITSGLSPENSFDRNEEEADETGIIP